MARNHNDGMLMAADVESLMWPRAVDKYTASPPVEFGTATNIHSIFSQVWSLIGLGAGYQNAIQCGQLLFREAYPQVLVADH